MAKKAFTLIELLVVIAIIAILAAILFPVFAQAKNAAKKAVSISNTKQVLTAHLMYVGDYDDQMVPYLWYDRGDGVFLTWMEMINPYIKSKDIFLNPAQSRTATTYSTGCSSTANPTVVSHFAMPTWVPFNYWNWWGTVMFAGFPALPQPSGTCGPDWLAARPWAACTSFTYAAEPSSTALTVPGYFISYKRPTGAERDTQFGSACTTGFDPVTSPNVNGSTIQVFAQGGVYGMADGSAKWYGSTNMNRNASAQYSYAGGLYPASPFMRMRTQ